jgi:hypothetical protein
MSARLEADAASPEVTGLRTANSLARHNAEVTINPPLTGRASPQTN